MIFSHRFGGANFFDFVIPHPLAQGRKKWYNITVSINDEN